MFEKSIKDFRVCLLWEVLTCLESSITLSDVCPELHHEYLHFVASLERHMPKSITVSYEFNIDN